MVSQMSVKPFKKITLQKQLYFIELLGHLLDQHYSLYDALQIINWQPNYNALVSNINQRLEEGIRFDNILTILKFDHRIITFIHFALIHGRLSQGFSESVKYISKEIELKQKLRKTLRYPLFLLISFITLVYFIQSYVYPNFMLIYQTNQNESQVLNIASSIIDQTFSIFIYFILILPIIAFTIMLLKRYMSTPRQILLISHIPILSSFIRSYNSFNFSIHLSSLIESNLSIKESFAIMSSQEKRTFFSQTVIDINACLISGLSLERSVLHPLLNRELSYIFQKKDEHMILKRDLVTFSELIVRTLTFRIEKVIHLIQPIIFGIVAISIILIYLSILLPMFDMINIF